MSDHITIKLSGYLENSTKNMIPAQHNILFDIYYKKMWVFELYLPKLKFKNFLDFVTKH